MRTTTRRGIKQNDLVLMETWVQPNGLMGEPHIAVYVVDTFGDDGSGRCDRLRIARVTRMADLPAMRASHHALDGSFWVDEEKVTKFRE